ncbi:MAG: hypothetical protein KDB27_13160 [Planctomycetales bacterium]|nr:hypothetical protein [Planctomycetales bacterium]
MFAVTMRSLVIWGLVVGAVWAQAEATSPTKDEDAPSSAEVDQASVRKFFERFYEATNDESGNAVLGLMDADSYINEIIAASTKKLNFLQRMMVRRSAKARMASAFRYEFGVWKTYRVTNIKVDGDKATALVRHWDEEGLTDRQVFMLSRHGKSWRFYDIESVSTGLSMLAMAKGFMLQVQDDPAAAEMARASVIVVNAMKEAYDYWEVSSGYLAELEGKRLPPVFRAPRWLIEVSARTQSEDGRGQYNLHLAKKLRATGPNCILADYLSALCLYNLSRHEEAIEAANNYIAAVGPDADTEYIISLAYVALDQPDKAIAACLRGLDDTPSSLDIFIQLATILPEDQVHVIAERLSKIEDAADQFETLANGLSYIDRPKALEALVDAYEKINPNDPNVAYYRAQAKAEQKQYSAAADILKSAIPTIDDEEEREYFVDLYLDCRAEAGQSLDAYNESEDRAYAFNYLADTLIIKEKVDEARQLIERHRSANPDDAAGHFFEGSLLRVDKKTEQAIESYLKAQSLFPNEELADRLFYELLDCWLELDKPLEAYRRSKQKDVALVELCERLDADEQWDKRIEVIKLHESQFGPSHETTELLLDTLSKQGKHAKVVPIVQSARIRLAAELDTKNEDDDDYYDVYYGVSHQLFEHHFRSLLKLQRFHEAMALAKESTEETDDPYYEVIVNASIGDVDACEAAVETCFNFHQYRPDGLLRGEDELKAILQTKPFEKIWLRFFQPRVLSLTAMTERPIDLTTDRFVEAVSKAFDDTQFKVYTDGKVGKSNENFVEIHGDRAYSVNYKSHSFFVLWENGKYAFHPKYVDALTHDQNKNAVKQHQAWLAVDMDVWPGRLATVESHQLLARLLRQLTHDRNTLALMETETAGVQAFSPEVDTQLQSEHPRHMISQMEVPDVQVDAPEVADE